LINRKLKGSAFNHDFHKNKMVFNIDNNKKCFLSRKMYNLVTLKTGGMVLKNISYFIIGINYILKL